MSIRPPRFLLALALMISCACWLLAGSLATDNFNRADSSDLGANWTPRTGANRNFQILTNAVSPATQVSDAHEFYSAITWPDDQYSQATITILTGTNDQAGIGVGVRTSTDPAINTKYRHIANKHATLGSSISKTVAGTYTLLAQRDADWVVGDVIYLEVQGTTLIAKRNGVALGASITDSAIASGAPSIEFSSTMDTSRIDDWEGGDFAGGAARRRVIVTFSRTQPPASKAARAPARIPASPRQVPSHAERSYLMPIIGTGVGTDMRRPKYAFGGNWTMEEDRGAWALVTAEMTPATDAAMRANADVFALPLNPQAHPANVTGLIATFKAAAAAGAARRRVVITSNLKETKHENAR